MKDRAKQVKFNPPPDWPLPPDFVPAPGWAPDPAWPPAPTDWPLWVVDEDAPLIETPIRWRWMLNPRRYALGFLATFGAVVFTFAYPRSVAVWTEDPPSRWWQAIAVLLGVSAVWTLIRAISVTHLLGVTTVEQTDNRRYFELIELAVARIGYFSLLGTFLALMAASGVGDNGVKATSLISDLATLGALAGLVTCIPAGLSYSRKSLRVLRVVSRLAWIRARLALGCIDLIVALHVLFVLVQAGQDAPFPDST